MIDTIEKRKPHRRKSFAAALLLGSSSLVSCAPSAPSVPSETATCIYTEKSSEIIITTDQVIRCLGGVAIRGRAPKTGYSRDQFGNGWGTVEGCDTRNFILKRDLKNAVIENKCKVLSGILDDPYTGKSIPFKRGQDTSSIVQIDHIESLSDAWQKGADTAHMSAKEREQLANDPKNLLAVYGPANDKKSDGDAATWLPDNKGYRCEMVASQVIVKRAYNLWATAAEKTAITNVLATCPGETLHLPN